MGSAINTTGEGASSVNDHYTVSSTEGDRQYVRTVIAATRRDAKHTHHEHYPHATVTAVAEAHGNPAKP
jgi:hypothetical protein